MKVLYITNSVGMGGASVAILNILPFLIKLGVRPYVLYPQNGLFSERLNELGIENGALHNSLEIYPPIKSIKDFLKFPYKLIKLILNRRKSYSLLCKYVEKFKPDIIHTNVGPIHIGYKVAKKYKIPHVWHIREYQIEDFGMHPFPSLNCYIKELHDSRNICISITKEIFRHFNLDPQKDKVIYDGVINKKNCPTINSKKENYILFAGRLEDAKGIKSLIKAYNKYRESGGKLDLLIAGKGSSTYIQECNNLVLSQYKENVVFLGERKDVFKLMYNALIFVVPSRNEGFGFITAEAMFNGTIVIGRNIGGTKEQFDNGLEFSGEEIAYRYITEDELITLLLKLESKIDYHKLEIAQKVVCELYDIEKQSQKVFNMYKDEKNNYHYN